jgi:hypothetical protein
MTTTRTKSPPGIILVADIARFWTEERRKKHSDAPEIKTETVLRYLGESRQDGGRYKANPMPLPEDTGGGYLNTSRQAPWWPDSTEQAHRDWFNNRPGHGHGTGGRYAGRAAKVAKPAKRRAGTGRKAAGKK